MAGIYNILGKIIRVDRNYYRGIGVSAASVMFAHTVDAYPAVLTRGIDNVSAGAHAEAVNTPSVLCLIRDLVVGRRKTKS